jgi:Family of unknown function (DUF6159)
VIRGFQRSIGAWLIVAAIPFIGGVGWIIASVQTRRVRYLLAGLAFLASGMPDIIMSDSEGYSPALAEVFGASSWLISLVLALILRKRVNLERKYAREARDREDEEMEREIAGRHGVRDSVAGPPSDGREGRIRRSWRLTKTAWALVRRDRAMLALALLGMTSALIWLAVFTLMGVYSDSDGGQGKVLLATLIALYPATFTGVFFNVALASAANATIDGRHLSFGEAVGESRKRLGKIALWSLLSAGVGAVLSELSSRLPGGGKIATWLVGAAWGLATLFVVPILATEAPTPGPITAVKQSASVVRQRWGEGISGTITIGAWTMFILIPAALLIGIGFSVIVSGPAGVGAALIGIGGVLLFSVVALSSAVQQVFSVCLYRYATDGAVREFSEHDLADPPFRRRRGFLR